jgi:hypothetical protein
MVNDTTAGGLHERYELDPSGCWLWTGATTTGYGVLKVDGKRWLAHRWSYEQLVGPVPVGLQLDHLCRVRRCVNPAHLEPVTLRENVLRGVGPSAVNAAKTECQNGHPFNDANTCITAVGNRRCRECWNAYKRAYRARTGTR